MKLIVQKNRIFTDGEGKVLTTDNVESIFCEFVFDQEFAGLDTYALFYRNADLQVKQKLTRGRCTVPWEVLQTPGVLYIGAYGEKLSGETVVKRVTTNFVALQVATGLSREVTDGLAPTPELWEIYRQELLGYKKAAEDAAEESGVSAEAAASAIKTAQMAADNAALSTEEALAYSEAALQAKNEAQSIKDSTELFCDVQKDRVGFRRADEPSFTYTGDLTGPRGRSGVYVGSGEMPEDYNIQIDPMGGVICYDAEETDERYANAITDTASGRLVALSDAWTGSCLSRCVIEGKTIEIGSGEKSLDNLYRFNGIDPVKITSCGKNLLPNFARSDTANGVTYTINPDRSITVNGTASAMSQLYLFGGNSSKQGTIVFPSSSDYCFSGLTQGLGLSARGADGSYLGITDMYGVLNPKSKWCDKEIVSIYLQINAGTTLSNFVARPQLELGSVSTEYEQGFILDTLFPEIEPLYRIDDLCDVYNAVSGRLTRRLWGMQLDGNKPLSNTETIPPAGYASFMMDIPAIGTGSRLLCNGLPLGSYTEIDTAMREFCWRKPDAPGIGFVIKLERLSQFGATSDRNTHVAACQMYLNSLMQNGKPLTMLAVRENPMKQQLSPVSIRIGTHPAYLFANDGEMDVTYTKDTNLVLKQLEKRITELEAAR